MRLGLGSRQFVVDTAVPSDVLAVWLRPHIGPRSGLFVTSGPLYRGQVIHSGFTLRRHINYQNGFLPVVEGEFRPHPQGTAVHITVRLPGYAVPLLAMISVLGLSITAVLGLAFAATGILAEQPGLLALLAVGPVLGAVFFLTMALSLAYETTICQRDLTRILTGLPARPSLSELTPAGSPARPVDS